MKKSNLIVLSFILCISLMTPITAEASVLNEPICVERISYDYVTSPEELLQLVDAEKNLARTAMVDEELAVDVEQLIEESTYSDGSIVKKYAKSSIQLVESSSRAIDNSNQQKSWGKYDIACVVTAYYEEHYGAGTQTGIVLLCTTFSFNDAGSNSVYVSKVEMYSHCIYDPTSAESVERYATYNNPSQGVLYSLNSDDDRIYGGGGFQSMYCGAVVSLSDGTSSGEYDLMIILR